MNAIKSVLATVTVWHVAGKVNLAKCNLTGKFVKNAIGQAELENVIIVNHFKKVNANVNWFAICGSLFFAMLFVLIVTFAVVMFTINVKTVILSSLIVVTFAMCFGLIVADNKHFSVEFKTA